MTPLYAPDKKHMLGFIMIDYDDDTVMRVLLPGPEERMPTAQELLDRARGYDPLHDEQIVLDFHLDILTSQRMSDCGADFITKIWTTPCHPDYLHHLPRELFQTVPEALGCCRPRIKRQ